MYCVDQWADGGEHDGLVPGLGRPHQHGRHQALSTNYRCPATLKVSHHALLANRCFPATLKVSH